MNAKVREWLVNEVLGMEDEEMIASLYSDYLATLDGEIEKAKGEICGGDFQNLDVTAHTLKGSTLTVGDTEMYESVIRLRDAAKASDSPGASAALAEIVALRSAR